MSEEVLIEQSAELGELFKSLAKAQAEMTGARKAASNPFFKSKYADLTEVRRASAKIHEFGICISQFPVGTNSLRTILGHESGQFISGVMSMKPTKSDPQGCGSALTYMRRYAMQSILGIPSEDDDGNLASTPAKKSKYSKAQQDAIVKVLIEKAPGDMPEGDPNKGEWSDSDWDKAAGIARKLRSK